VSPAAGLISTASSVDRWLEEVLSQLLCGGEEQVRVFYCMANEQRSPPKGGGRPRVTSSRSPAKKGADDLAAGLSARMGDLMLTDKEATGLVIGEIGSSSAPRPRWAVVGKVCSPRRLMIGALERRMYPMKRWNLCTPAPIHYEPLDRE
jgi:hypothetical protein